MTQKDDALPLSQLRQQIDELDSTIHGLLNQRAKLANQVAKRKALDATEGEQVEYYRPEREAQVLQKIKKRNQGPLCDEEVARIFREIMSACLALEQPLEVAYLGPAGTFTHAAALKHFGHSVKCRSVSGIDQVFHEVEVEACHYGVVPIENSTEGVVSHTLDLFIASDLKIIGEISLRIHQNLMSKSQHKEEIKRIYSHQQSLAQCRNWLDLHYPDCDKIPVKSNAEAAHLASEEPNSAAIAGVQAAELYQLPILYKNIEDNDENTTRFLILGKKLIQIDSDELQDITPDVRYKTSLLAFAANQPGSLFNLLKPLAEHQISMSRIESRPSKCGVWEYVFFIDIEGHLNQPTVQLAFAEIEKSAKKIKVLGSYPQAVL